MTELSDRLSVLFEEYPGDKAWKKFASSFPVYDTSTFENIPIEPDCIRVMFWKKGDNINKVQRWLNKPIQALDGKSPLEIIELNEGPIILRTILMRMP